MAAIRIRCGHCGNQHESVAAVRRCGQLQMAAPVAKPGPATVGMYRKLGQVYRVDNWRGHLVASRLDFMDNPEGVHWAKTIVPGMARRLTQADRMDITEVAAFGHLTGQCMRCGRELTRPDSVAKGIGPECIKMI